jgi:hypothetical protein
MVNESASTKQLTITTTLLFKPLGVVYMKIEVVHFRCLQVEVGGFVKP